MKKLLVFLCVVFMILGVLGCRDDSSRSSSNPGSFVSTKVVDSTNSVYEPENTPNPSPVPEPATILLLGSGLVGLVGIGRKKFFDKDKDIG